MTAPSAPRFGIRRPLKTAAIIAGCATAMAFVLLPIGRPATRMTAETRIDGTTAKPACSEHPREILIDGRRVEAYEVVCGERPTTLAALPAVDEAPPTWSTSSPEAALVASPVEDADTGVEAPPKHPPAVISRAKPKPRAKPERVRPRPSVTAAATSVSQEKYGP
jgi:hypothetical protein